MAKSYRFFPNWYVNLFKNNERFLLLKATARITGAIVALSHFLIFKSDQWALVTLALSVLFMDCFLLIICRLKESAFKDEAFFETHYPSPKNLDRYAVVNTLSRVILFSAILVLEYNYWHPNETFMSILGVTPFFYAVISLIAVAISCAIVDRVPKGFSRRSNNTSSSQYQSSDTYDSSRLWDSPSTISTVEPTYTGMAGVDAGGMYTGSSSAIGGMSS